MLNEYLVIECMNVKDKTTMLLKGELKEDFSDRNRIFHKRYLLFYKLYFIVYAITVVPVSPFLPPSTQPPHPLRQSPHHCPCLWVLHICSLATLSPMLYFIFPMTIL